MTRVVPASPPHALFAGVDIGGTTIRAVLCTPELRLVAGAEAPTPAASGGAAMVRTATALIRGLVEKAGAGVSAVGVGAAGVVDSAGGRILAASDSFHDWAGFAVAEALEDALDVAAHLDNDVNAFLRAEVLAGAAAGCPDALGITLGTGVGGALWLGGRLFDGPHGAAGEIGHIPGFGELPCTCGGRGHLETLASGRLISARYAERTGRTASARELFGRAGGGDRDAVAVFEAAGAALARGILITAGLVDVTTVVIGGGVSGAWPLLHPAILRALAAEPPVSGRPIELVRSALGSDAVALGAAAGARDRFSDLPYDRVTA